MKELKVGDIRKEGDEQRRAYGSEEDYAKSYRVSHAGEFVWHPTDLLGHAILPSDLFVLEFRRP